MPGRFLPALIQARLEDWCRIRSLPTNASSSRLGVATWTMFRGATSSRARCKFFKDQTRVQIMHNGIRVLADGYCGEWMTQLIAHSSTSLPRTARRASLPRGNGPTPVQGYDD